MDAFKEYPWLTAMVFVAFVLIWGVAWALLIPGPVGIIISGAGGFVFGWNLNNIVFWLVDLTGESSSDTL